MQLVETRLRCQIDPKDLLQNLWYLRWLRSSASCCSCRKQYSRTSRTVTIPSTCSGSSPSASSSTSSSSSFQPICRSSRSSPRKPTKLPSDVERLLLKFLPSTSPASAARLPANLPSPNLPGSCPADFLRRPVLWLFCLEVGLWKCIDPEALSWNLRSLWQPVLQHCSSRSSCPKACLLVCSSSGHSATSSARLPSSS